jgi:ketosteroid isomerase-like protein
VVALDPLSVVQGAYSAFACGDTPGLLERLAPSVVWEVAGQPGAHPTFGIRRGREGALEFLHALDAAETFEAFAPQRFHEAGSTVVVEGAATVTFKVSRRTIHYDWVHIWTVRDGVVVAFREFCDTARVAEAFAA